MSEPFENAGTVAGVQVWRIQDLQPQPVEPSGKLYSGDSYVILNTFSSGASPALSHEICFWIGKECSQDESAGAAIIAVQLDNALSEKGCDASISRHTQGAEGENLLSLFPKGLQILDGGVKGALKSAESETVEPKLYCISGKRKFKISSVPVKADSLNTRDGFVLDCGSTEDHIIQWVNENASPLLKFKTLNVATDLKDEYHAGEAEMSIITSSEPASDVSNKFYKILGVDNPANFTPSEPPAAKSAPQAKLWAIEYHCEGREGPLGWPLLQKASPPRVKNGEIIQKIVSKHSVQSVGDAPSAHMLSSDALVAMYAGSSLWLWVGKSVPIALRKEVFTIGNQICSKAGIKPQTVEVVKQNLEGPLFTQFFPDWEAVEQQAVGKAKRISVKGEPDDQGGDSVEAKAHATKILSRASAAQEPVLLDDGTGTKKVWRIEKFDLAEVAPEKYGCFTSGDCYIVLYSYGSDPQQHIIYMWQGADCSVDERGACAISAVRVDEEHCGGAAPQVRVVEGKEPPHFVALWQGSMVVYTGGVASGFKTLQEDDSADGAGVDTRLFQVRASVDRAAYATQVPASASSLNSGDVFLLVTKTKVIMWHGDAASESEQEVAATVSETLLEGTAEREPELITEGEESEEFWQALGGQGEYAKIPHVAVRHAPRLFCISDTLSGGSDIICEEILHFAQSDLDSSEVMLLDTHAEVFVWIGSNSSTNEQQKARNAAERYLSQASRDANIPITTVLEKQEPLIFTAYFHAWDRDRTQPTAADYEARIQALKSQSSGGPAGGKKGTMSEPVGADVKEAQPEGVEPAEPVVEAENVEEAKAEEVVTQDAQPTEETPEESVVKVKDNIFKASDSTNGSVVSATEGVPRLSVGSPTGSTRGRPRNITVTTPLGGSYEVSDVDPSGSKGSPDARKYKPGEDVIDLEELKTMKGSDGIDPTAKEKYLSEEVFMEVFGVSPEAFSAMPLWKRQQKKKAAGLF